jgi:predicted cupin superfamily sugar epimerase
MEKHASFYYYAETLSLPLVDLKIMTKQKQKQAASSSRHHNIIIYYLLHISLSGWHSAWQPLAHQPPPLFMLLLFKSTMII